MVELLQLIQKPDKSNLSPKEKMYNNSSYRAGQPGSDCSLGRRCSGGWAANVSAEAFPRSVESYNDADLKKYFNNEVSPGGIPAGAVVPTAIVWLIFLVFR